MYEEYKSEHTGPVIDAGITRVLPGGEIDQAINSKPNPNLLDNWYFGNPVNQRGFTTTTTSGSYCVDRWYIDGYRIGTREITLNDGYILLSCDDNTGDAYYELVQYIEANIGKSLVEKQVTLSILSDQGLNYQTFVLQDNTYATFDIDTRGTAFVRAKIDGTAEVRIRTYYGESINIVAVKLELGSQQTLAHQDASGNWVLNEIPDYGEQLRRCQRYFVNFNPNKMTYFTMPPAVASATTQAYSSITLPVAMRAQPVVSYGGRIYLSNIDDITIADMAVSENTFTGIAVQLRYGVISGLTQNSLYRVQGGADTTAYIHLSADL